MTRNASQVTDPIRQMEEEAYHAYREWPIFLVLRRKELERHLSGSADRKGRAERASREGVRRDD